MPAPYRIRVSHALYERIVAAAAARGSSVSEWVRLALRRRSIFGPIRRGHVDIVVRLDDGMRRRMARCARQSKLSMHRWAWLALERELDGFYEAPWRK